MFEGADKKLQDARAAIKRLQELVQPPLKTNIQIKSGPSGTSGESVGIDDPVAFSEAFSSCVAQIRSVGDAILSTSRNKTKIEQTEKKWPGFKNWRKKKIYECKNDGLMSFINDQRNDDLHEGDCCLSFTMHAYEFSSDTVGIAPIRGATLRINGTGPHWIHQDIPDEHYPCKIQDRVVYTASIINPPTIHKGKPLPSTDLLTICTMSEKYYTDLLREARSLFKQ